MEDLHSITILNIIIAFGMFYVAYQQLRANEKPFNQNLLDRRYEFLKNILEFHGNDGYRNCNPNVPLDEIDNKIHNKYLQNLDMGRFLINEVDYKKICEIELSMGNAQMNGCDNDTTIKYLQDIRAIMLPYFETCSSYKKYFPTYRNLFKKLLTQLSKNVLP